MSHKPVVPREAATRDVEDAADGYALKAGETVALGFIEALAEAYNHIALYPATGSPRHAEELGLPGLRSWRLKRYPYLVFYVERDDHVDVWRVLHGERDIPAWIDYPGFLTG